MINLKGNKKSGYVLTIKDKDWKDDIQITDDELYELYKILENKFGEFAGYIKKND